MMSDDDAEADDVDDDWEKGEEGDDDWDPDFDEFDIPEKQRRCQKAAGTFSKKKGDDDDDFKIDEDFKEFDLFNDKSGGFDDDEDDDF
jgi:DNA-directed RNA polymerase subunit delta